MLLIVFEYGVDIVDAVASVVVACDHVDGIDMFSSLRVDTHDDVDVGIGIAVVYVDVAYDGVGVTVAMRCCYWCVIVVGCEYAGVVIHDGVDVSSRVVVCVCCCSWCRCIL